MPYDVTMPDGTIIHGVPEGTTKAELQRKYAAHAQNAKPTSFLQGLGEGLTETLANAYRTIERAAPSLTIPTAVAGTMLNSALNGRFAPATGTQAVLAESGRQARLAPTRGSAGGRLTGQVVGSLPFGGTRLGPALEGAIQGYLTSDNPDDTKSALTGAGYGLVGGKAGQVVGSRVVAPVAERIGRTKAARTVSAAAVNLANRAGANLRQLPLPQFSQAERMVARSTPELSAVQSNLHDAARLNLPYTLADAAPQLRTLAGSVVRKSPDAHAMAEKTFLPRALGQADRAVEAIDTHLAPITDIEARAADIRKGAQKAAQPFYDAAYARPAPVDPQIAQMLNTPAGKAALKDAHTIALNRGMNPNELGFIVDDAGNVGLQSEAGRYVSATLGNPRDQLNMGTLRGANGSEYSQRGPMDLVGWLRKNGGLTDQNGELAHMGIGNAGRSGMDFTGLEARLGPLVHDRGMNFDDAANAAWEAGYFPHLTDRPSVNQFLDAVRGTHEGWGRHFLPEDAAQIADFASAQAQRNSVGRASAEGRPVFDTSIPAGPDVPFAPMEAYGEKQVSLPTMETLDLVKQALDGRLNGLRNPMTGKLDLEGDKVAGSINDLLQRFKGRLDDASPDYWAARNAYQEAIAPRTALRLGYSELPKPTTMPRQFEAALNSVKPENLPEVRRGYATALSDRIGNVSESVNPYSRIYGSPNQQAKIGSLFPEGADNFGRHVGLESDMSKTAYETLGGSPTQARNMADQMFDSAGGTFTDLGLAVATGGKLPLAKRALQMLADARRVGVFKEKADGLAPVLFDQDTRGSLAYWDALLRKQQEQATRAAAYQKAGSLLGGPAAIGAVALTQP
jgi:hypothetical protein